MIFAFSISKIAPCGMYVEMKKKCQVYLLWRHFKIDVFILPLLRQACQFWWSNKFFSCNLLLKILSIFQPLIFQPRTTTSVSDAPQVTAPFASSLTSASWPLPLPSPCHLLVSGNMRSDPYYKCRKDTTFRHKFLSLHQQN